MDSGFSAYAACVTGVVRVLRWLHNLRGSTGYPGTVGHNPPHRP
jgi:hypothetical protein